MAGQPVRTLRNLTRDEDGLTVGERKFVDRVMIHADIDRAHREAFPGSTNKSYMKRAEVAAVIRRETEKRTTRYGLTADNLIKELSYIIFGRNRDIYNEDGTLKAITDLDDATDASIAGIDIEDIRIESEEDGEVTTTTRVKKYKRYSKSEAISLALKLKSLADIVAPTRSELTGADGAPLLAPPVINVKFGSGK